MFLIGDDLVGWMGWDGIDPLMSTEADRDIAKCKARLKEAEDGLISHLLPEDPDSMKDVILELRAGTGGDEACLFCLDVMRMYQKLAATKGWSCQLLSMSPQEGREVVLKFAGEDVHRLLQHESGGHRVQRVPVTGQPGIGSCETTDGKDISWT